MLVSPSVMKTSAKKLSSVGIERPEKELEKMLAYSGDNVLLFESVLERRLKREPLERIFGSVDFFDLTFKIHEAVFKPGFETETTMEYGLLFLEKKDGPLRILDLGTGNGCILLSLLHRLPNATGVGVDCNPHALEVAEENAIAHNLSDRAIFHSSNWMEGITEGPFDLIISNPPRIPTKAIPHLVREVSEYDPPSALDGTADGLEFYRRTAAGFRDLATPDAQCVIQVGAIIANQALLLFQRAGYTSATIKRDYKSAPNCIMFEKDPEPPPGLGARFVGLLRTLWK
jgi:release factor glutamine methyltransferase